MRSLGTVFVRSYSLLVHPQNIRNIQSIQSIQNIQSIQSIRNTENPQNFQNPQNPQNPQNSAENGEITGRGGDSDHPEPSNGHPNSENTGNENSSSPFPDDKSVVCSRCGNRLGSFIDEEEPNFTVELLKDRISFESKPFYSTVRRIFVELLDFYRWK